MYANPQTCASTSLLGGNVSGVVAIERALALMAAAAQNAEVEIETTVGVHVETGQARLWRGQVLVDWEPDPNAGGCLVRPDQVERLIALHATTRERPTGLDVVAAGRIVSGLSPQHAGLVNQLGGARRVELGLQLTFTDDRYVGGTETYWLVEGSRRAVLIRIVARVHQRAVHSGGESPRTSREPS